MVIDGPIPTLSANRSLQGSRKEISREAAAAKSYCTKLKSVSNTLIVNRWLEVLGTLLET
ncbi:MAG: hypothetical protein DMG84_21240 [Acidobacteria bacterium]|nr:MAG: hypothetical protein DMG85_07360 [Acidobacteriota bacterium]PYX12632.1 MAG: hypothetical protein DMG84_21240 [Acidobacteriota bacterium]PYX63453.1 MAG: hypothetical protein DMG74_16990 [Acidobacteriota bacterium]